MVKKEDFDFRFDWHLTDLCNFDCQYCHPQIKRNKNRPLPHNYTTEEIADSFNSLEGLVHVSMSGGEPFMYPDYIELCKRLTENNFISINTNLSSDDVFEFAEVIDPKHVTGIYAAEHIMERERLKIPISDFIEKLLFLQDQEFNTMVFYVLYPPLINRFEKDLDFLLDNGVQNVALKLFKGSFEGRIFPEQYNDEERMKILSYQRNMYPLTIPYLEGNRSFTGKLCEAGHKSFKVEVDGKVKRCLSVAGVYGNLYEGTLVRDLAPRPCRAGKTLSIGWCHENLLNE